MCLMSRTVYFNDSRKIRRKRFGLSNNIFVIIYLFCIAVAANEVAEPQGVGTSVGIGAGVIIFILIILGLVYLRL